VIRRPRGRDRLVPELPGPRSPLGQRFLEPGVDPYRSVVFGLAKEIHRESRVTQGAFCFLVKGCPPALIAEMIRKAFHHKRHAERGEQTAAG